MEIPHFFGFITLGVLCITAAISMLLLHQLVRLDKPVPGYHWLRHRARTIVAAAFAFLTIGMVPAWAAAAAASTLLNIPQPLWDEINAVIIGIVLGLLGLAFKWLNDHSPVKNAQVQQMARDAFTTFANNAAKYGLSQLQSSETRVGEIDVGNAAVAATANFIIAQGPKIAADVGFDVTTPDGRAAIIRSATLRVADLASPVGAAPKPITLPDSVAAPVAPATGATVPPPSAMG